MKRSVQMTLLIAITFVGLVVFRATADEPKDKPQPKLSANEKIRIQAAKARRTFGSLLQKGQLVTLYQMRQEAPTGYQYQVRVVREDQKKQIEEVVERNRKELEAYQSKKSALEKELREAVDRPKQAELREAYGQLRQTYKSTSLPTDIRSAKFYTISDVGGDYVGFEQNGVETFHRLTSIHRIIRGVELAEE